MSLDLTLECPHCREGNFTINVTYNLAPMWRAALNDPDCVFIDVDGLTGLQSQALFAKAYEVLINDPVRFKEMNPPNGWGGLVAVVAKCHQAAIGHPDYIWRASR